MLTYNSWGGPRQEVGEWEASLGYTVRSFLKLKIRDKHCQASPGRQLGNGSTGLLLLYSDGAVSHPLNLQAADGGSEHSPSCMHSTETS